MSRPQIQQFFVLQGSKIKGLRLNFEEYARDSATAESFTDLFMNKTRNVECLTLSEIQFYWRIAIERTNQRQILNINRNKNLQGDETQNANASADLPVFSLAKLRCFRFFNEGLKKTAQTLIKEIVVASPALKKVFILGHPWLDEFDFDYLTSISKGHLVTRVNLSPKVKNMDILTNFAQSQGQGQGQGLPRPRLTHLSLSMEFVDGTRPFQVQESISFESFVPIASALLESSKDSLEFFSMPQGKRVKQFLQLDKTGDRYRIPILKNVKIVCLYCRERPSQNQSRGWPIPAKQFKRIFPKARELWLRGKGRGGGIMLFPIGGPAVAAVPIENLETQIIPQITDISLCGRFTREFLNNIPLNFCNVVELCIENRNPVSVIPLVWRFGFTNLRLKKLTLEISMDQNPNPNPNLLRDAAPPANADAFANLYPVLTFPQLDAALTGFPEEACAQLLSLYPEILDAESVKEIRINPSILDLKYLEKFVIKFWIYGEEQLPENILTVESGAYAFEWESSKLEQGKKPQVQVQVELFKAVNQGTSAIISKKQRAEIILKPLSPYAKVTFTIDKI